MENLTTLDSDSLQSNLELNSSIRTLLKQTAPWTKFLGIMGFIFCGLFLILALAMGAMSGAMYSSAGMPWMTSFISGIYVVLALVYVMPSLYLFRFSSKIKSALSENKQEELDNAFAQLKGLFRYMGILTIIFICIYPLFILIFFLSKMM